MLGWPLVSSRPPFDHQVTSSAIFQPAFMLINRVNRSSSFPSLCFSFVSHWAHVEHVRLQYVHFDQCRWIFFHWYETYAIYYFLLLSFTNGLSKLFRCAIASKFSIYMNYDNAMKYYVHFCIVKFSKNSLFGKKLLNTETVDTMFQY